MLSYNSTYPKHVEIVLLCVEKQQTATCFQQGFRVPKKNHVVFMLFSCGFFFKLYAFILLTSTLVPGINYVLNAGNGPKSCTSFPTKAIRHIRFHRKNGRMKILDSASEMYIVLCTSKYMCMCR